MPGGCKERVHHGAVSSPGTRSVCICLGFDTLAVPLVAALQSTRLDRAARCQGRPLLLGLLCLKRSWQRNKARTQCAATCRTAQARAFTCFRTPNLAHSREMVGCKAGEWTLAQDNTGSRAGCSGSWQASASRSRGTSHASAKIKHAWVRHRQPVHKSSCGLAVKAPRSFVLIGGTVPVGRVRRGKRPGC